MTLPVLVDPSGRPNYIELAGVTARNPGLGKPGQPWVRAPAMRTASGSTTGYLPLWLTTVMLPPRKHPVGFAGWASLQERAAQGLGVEFKKQTGSYAFTLPHAFAG